MRDDLNVLTLRLCFSEVNVEEPAIEKRTEKETKEENLPFPVSNYTPNLRNADFAFSSRSSQYLFTVSPALSLFFSQYPGNE